MLISCFPGTNIQEVHQCDIICYDQCFPKGVSFQLLNTTFFFWDMKQPLHCLWPALTWVSMGSLGRGKAGHRQCSGCFMSQKKNVVFNSGKDTPFGKRWLYISRKTLVRATKICCRPPAPPCIVAIALKFDKNCNHQFAWNQWPNTKHKQYYSPNKV